MLSSKEEEKVDGLDAVPDGSTACLEPFETVEVTAGQTVSSAVEEPYVSTFFDNINIERKQAETISEDDLKKEVIRQAMSELGKRSAAARLRKKATLQN